MNNRVQYRCPQCGRAVKSLGGLGRHRCKVAVIPQRRHGHKQHSPREEEDYTSGRKAPPRFEVALSELGTRRYRVDTSEYCFDNGQNNGLGRDSHVQRLDSEYTSEDMSDSLVLETGEDFVPPSERQNEYAQEIPLSTYATTEASGTSGATRLIEWGADHETEQLPGQIVTCEDLESGENPRGLETIDKDDPFYPFVSRHDWVLADWFSSARLSKGKIEDYLKEEAFMTKSREVPGAITTYADLKRTWQKVPYGIRDDHWKAEQFRVPTQAGVKEAIHTVIFRSMKDSLEFLLSYQPFASELSWAPVQKYYGDIRVYDEMYTADWWWEKQSQLPPGATIVPVILSTDKTLMTKLRGDKSAWPVYMTIGNLSRRVRRMQNSPGSLLIGLLPISKEISKDTDADLTYSIKSALYHQSMEVILEEIEALTISGCLVTCADGHIRQCYPIISNMLCDYEEVTLITGIKKNAQCGTCQVQKHKLGDLAQTWPFRTHTQMQQQMQKQIDRKIPSKDLDWVHHMDSFAWKHSFLNIHEAISVDILHQLQKGVFRDLINWIEALVADLFPGQRATKNKRKSDRTFKESPGIVQLDARFATIPKYPGLKHFSHFSHITQWTGNEENALMRILIPAITPLLINKAPDALQYARALIDFIFLAQYRTHNEHTLRYMEQAVIRIDNLKGAFAEYRPLDVEDEAHFNYPKFHAISHYVRFIRRYGPATGFDTAHPEHNHMTRLKAHYTNTNKTDDYLNQICEWNIRDTNRMAMNDHLLSHFATRSQEGVEIEAQVTSMARNPIPIARIGCQELPQRVKCDFRYYRLDCKATTTVREAERATGLKGFSAALAVFVKARRAELAGERVQDNPADVCEADSFWILDYPLQFFPSLQCWKRTGKDDKDSEAQEHEYLRCTNMWRGGEARKDFCWVQEYSPDVTTHDLVSEDVSRIRSTKLQAQPLNGQLVGQIQALVKVVDIGYPKVYDRLTTPAHCAALVDIYPLRNRGEPHEVHGMIEVNRPNVPVVDNPRRLKGRRFYPLPAVLRSAHVVPSFTDPDSQHTNLFYINNYIDWDQYQVLYEDDWEEKGIQRALKIKKQHDIARQKAKES